MLRSEPVDSGYVMRHAGINSSANQNMWIKIYLSSTVYEAQFIGHVPSRRRLEPSVMIKGSVSSVAAPPTAGTETLSTA